MNLTKQDYEAIKQMALRELLDKPTPYPEDDRLMLAKLYSDATLNYLEQKGYMILKEVKRV